MTTTDTQSKQILRYLRAGHSITPLEALRRFGTFRLAARVKDLREAGHPIITRIIDDGERRYAQYRLERKAAA